MRREVLLRTHFSGREYRGVGFLLELGVRGGQMVVAEGQVPDLDVALLRGEWVVADFSSGQLCSFVTGIAFGSLV